MCFLFATYMVPLILFPILIVTNVVPKTIVRPVWIYFLSLLLVQSMYLCVEAMVSRGDGRHWLVQSRDHHLDMCKLYTVPVSLLLNFIILA
jgi:hypothetical protein